MSPQLITVLDAVIYVLLILILIEVVISNFLAYGRGVSPYNPVVRTIRKIVNPMLDPFRRILPPSRTGGWDFSPVFVMLILYVIRGLINGMR